MRIFLEEFTDEEILKVRDEELEKDRMELADRVLERLGYEYKRDYKYNKE